MRKMPGKFFLFVENKILSGQMSLTISKFLGNLKFEFKISHKILMRFLVILFFSVKAYMNGSGS